MGGYYRDPDYLICDLADLISHIAYAKYERGLLEAHEIKDLESFQRVLDQLNEISKTQA